jgi:uncharacterized protein
VKKYLGLLSLAFFLFFLNSGLAWAKGPSFDCSKASNAVEIVVCSNPRLSEFDQEMADIYKSAMANATDTDALKAQQRNWIRARNKECGPKSDVVKCLEASYQERIGQLRPLAEAYSIGGPPSGAGQISAPAKVKSTTQIESVRCPGDVSFEIKMEYPQNTGSPKVDTIILAYAESWLKESVDLANQTVNDEAMCEREIGAADANLQYEYHALSSGILSILFTEYGYTGGAHGYLDFHAFNFNIPEERSLSLEDLFPNPKDSLPAYWAYLYSTICSGGKTSMPSAFGQVDCQPGRPPKAPVEFIGQANSLESLGGLVITPKGATINLEPYSAWSWAEGSLNLDIPKKDLLKIGASPALW